MFDSLVVAYLGLLLLSNLCSSLNPNADFGTPRLQQQKRHRKMPYETGPVGASNLKAKHSKSVLLSLSYFYYIPSYTSYHVLQIVFIDNFLPFPSILSSHNFNLFLSSWGLQIGSSLVPNASRKKNSFCPFNLEVWCVRKWLPIEYQFGCRTL